MKQIPESSNALVLRTDYSDAAAWEVVRAAILVPVGGFQAYVSFVSDLAFEGLTVEQLRSLIPEGWDHTHLFVVDRITLSDAEHPILVVDLFVEPGRTFRVIPAEMWSVENNLSTGNMDFEEFAGAADRDGVFRGFRRS